MFVSPRAVTVCALAATQAPAGTAPVVAWSPWNGGAGAQSFDGATNFVEIAHAASQSPRRAVTLAARINVDAARFQNVSGEAPSLRVTLGLTLG